jgi:hypothetical protein
MLWEDHNWPHFHAYYSGQEAVYQVNPIRKKKGKFSKRANRLVIKWARLHRAELLMEWNVLSQSLPGFDIDGLK